MTTGNSRGSGGDPSGVPSAVTPVRPTSVGRVVVLLAGLLAVLVVLAPGRAEAHAVLEGGSVFDGQVLEVAPEELFLDFNEGISAPRGGLRVFDADGTRVDTGGTFQTDDADDLVRVALEPGLAEGTYAVTYRVTSADGHPVNGAFVFSIGAEAGAADALLGQVFSSGADRPWAVAAAIVRWVAYAGVLLAAGVALTAAWLRGTVLAAGSAVDRLARRSAVAVAVTAVLGVLLQNVLVSGDGVGSLVDGSGLWAVLSSFVGISALVRLVGAGIALVGLRRGSVGSALVVGGGLVMLGSLLLEGHTLTTGPAAVVWGGAAVHVLTAATWFGGLVLMALELRERRRADDPVAAGRLVARFSSLFTISVVAVVAAGSALSWAEVRALRALTSTTYGWVLVGKLAAVVPLIGLGLWNNRRLVPALTARRRRPRDGTRPAIATGALSSRALSAGTLSAGVLTIAGGSDEVADRAAARDDAWRMLGRTVRVEALIVVVVLALTSVLVALQPAAEAAGITGAFSANQEFPGLLGDDGGDGQLSVTVDPNRTGRNEVHIYLLTDVGRPFDGAEEVTMSLSQPELDIGPIVRTPTFAGKGHWILTGPELSVPGGWVLTTEVAISRFDVVSTTTEFTVNP